jgi:hypothetical protein
MTFPVPMGTKFSPKAALNRAMGRSPVQWVAPQRPTFSSLNAAMIASFMGAAPILLLELRPGKCRRGGRA